MLLQLSHFPPFTPLHPAHPLPPTFPPYSPCPQVIHINSLASPLPILFLTSPCLFSTYHLCYLFFSFFKIFIVIQLQLQAFSPHPNPLLITLHVISISVVLLLFQLFAQFAFVFVLGVVVNLSLIHISEPTRLSIPSRMPSSA